MPQQQTAIPKHSKRKVPEIVRNAKRAENATETNQTPQSDLSRGDKTPSNRDELISNQQHTDDIQSGSKSVQSSITQWFGSTRRPPNDDLPKLRKLPKDKLTPRSASASALNVNKTKSFIQKPTLFSNNIEAVIISSESPNVIFNSNFLF